MKKALPIIPHASEFIPHEIADMIRSYSFEAEKSGCLGNEQLLLIYEQRWFNLYVPAQFGGLELSLPEGLKMEEALAWADGSLGWVVTLCSGANWFIGFLDTDIAKKIFCNEKVCFAGSGKPSGTASITDNGFEITGSWNYASGASCATIFTANCIIEKNGVSLKNEDGSPMIKSFLFFRDEVTIDKDSWNTTGMIATASYSFKITNLVVQANRCFTIDSRCAVLPQTIFQFPFLQFAEATLAVNSSGMASRFIDVCEKLLAAKSGNENSKLGVSHNLMRELEAAKLCLQALRESFYSAIQLSWDQYTRKSFANSGLLSKVSKSSKNLASGSRALVDKLYPWCGLIAANPNTEMNLVWRNLHTASQHKLLLESD